MYTRALLLGLTILSLTACESYNQRRAQLILSKGWVGPTQKMTPPPLYCYRTIGQPQCYNHPQQGQEARLISAYYPQPVKICKSETQTTFMEDYVLEYSEADIFEPFPTAGPIQITPL